MLLFKPHHVVMIQQRRKRATRRLWKKPRAKRGAVHLVKTKMLSKEHHGKVRIDRVWKQRLLEISEEEAWAEGEYTREEYIDVFKALHPGLEEANPELYVVEFTYLASQNGVFCDKSPGGKT